MAPIDTASENPSVVQSISFTDYVTYTLNGSSNESSVEVVIFSDVVVATIISSVDDNESETISELLSFVPRIGILSVFYFPSSLISIC